MRKRALGNPNAIREVLQYAEKVATSPAALSPMERVEDLFFVIAMVERGVLQLMEHATAAARGARADQRPRLVASGEPAAAQSRFLAKHHELRDTPKRAHRPRGDACCEDPTRRSPSKNPLCE